jgi:hypothetical protein
MINLFLGCSRLSSIFWKTFYETQVLHSVFFAIIDANNTKKLLWLTNLLDKAWFELFQYDNHMFKIILCSLEFKYNYVCQDFSLQFWYSLKIAWINFNLYVISENKKIYAIRIYETFKKYIYAFNTN